MEEDAGWLTRPNRVNWQPVRDVMLKSERATSESKVCIRVLCRSYWY
jgi:hypothetical protein